MSRFAHLGFVALALIALVLSVFTSEYGQYSGTPATHRADKVVLFGIPRLSLGDVTSGQMPNLERLARHGTTGALRVKTPSKLPNAAEAYTSIGAGAAVSSGSSGLSAYGANEPYLGATALSVAELQTDKQLHGAVVVPWFASLDSKPGNKSPSGPGTLGSALHMAGHRTAVVTNADTWDLSGVPTRISPAALAIADHDGMIDAGTVAPSLLERKALAPYGLAVNQAGFAAEVRHSLDDADVVVADPGETLRAVNYLPAQTQKEAYRSRRRALARTDTVIGRVAAELPADTMLMVVGVTPGTTHWALAPVLLYGSGIPAGTLASPSTHRVGIGTYTDLAPTILATLGAPIPPSMRGRPLGSTEGTSSWASLGRLDRMLSARASTNEPTATVFITVQALLYLVAIVALLWIGAESWSTRAIEIVALTCAAWPLATFVMRLSVPLSSLGSGTILLTWLLAAGIGGASQLLKRHPLDPLLVVCGATIAVISIDMGTGAHLMLGSFFGYSPSTDGRYIGLDNAVFAMLAACTVIVCAALVDRVADRRTALWSAGVVAATAIVVDGAPWLGADVGGILTLVPVLGLMMWALSGRRIRRRALLLAVGAAIAVLAIAVGVDALRSPDQRTHIGRFFLGAGEGNGQLLTSTLSEKWTKNMHLFSQTGWAWVVPVVAAFSVYVLVVAKGWRQLLPSGSPRRTAVVTALAIGIIGWLVNDSGIVVTALVFVYFGPFILLLALRDSRVTLPVDPASIRPSPLLEAGT